MIRFAEALNDPKIPLEGDKGLKKTIKVVDANNNNVELPNWEVVIVSKDAAKYYLINTHSGRAQNIIEENLRLRFDYLLYTSTGYINQATEYLDVEVPQYITELSTQWQGETELNLGEVITAKKVSNAEGEEAEEYTFNVTGPNSYDETIVSTKRELNLGALAEPLLYNSTYTVKVKAKLKGVEMPYGASHTISTKALNFVIKTAAPAKMYVDDELEVRVELQFIDQSVYSAFTNATGMTLHLVNGSTTADYVLDFAAGKALQTITAAEAGALTLTKVDSATTGYGVTGSLVTTVYEEATKLEFSDITSPYTINVNHPITIEAQSSAGVKDVGYNGTIDFTQGSGPVKQVIIINGKGVVQISSAVVGTQSLSLSNSNSGLTLPANEDVIFE